jgi:hypothetical protein
MIGKILSYNKTKGIGKIIIKNQGVKLFNIDNWIDYNNSPEVGMEVEFGLEGGELIDITAVNSASALLEKLNTKLDYIVPPNLKIETTISINDCMEEFFGKYKKIVLKYKDLLDSKRNLPYLKLKRFIFTAYNNLIEMDSKISDTKLLEIKNNLEEIENYFTSLNSEIKSPVYVNLEKLVLKRQQNYVVTKKRFESNKDLSVEAITNANLLEPKIEKLEEEINNLNPKTKIYQEKVDLLKTYKRKYVDLIDLAQNLKEENSKIIDDITQFEEFYKEIFEKFFKQESSAIIRILEKELNALAYQFDTILWENAKKSKVIQHFFEEAKIEGSYSTKTFMKYYLKNLQTEKMNIKDSELNEIFEELKMFVKNIVIYDRNRGRARDISVAVENLDHDSDVKIFDNFKDFILYIKENDSKIDISLIEVDDRTIKTVEKIVFILNRIDVKTLLFSEILNNHNILKIKHNDIEVLKKEVKKMM